MAALGPLSGKNTPILIGSAAKALESMIPLSKAIQLIVIAAFLTTLISLSLTS